MLAFDETRHIYTMDGTPVPSVTQIMRPLYDFSAVDPDVLRRAADYGTAVHRVVELELNGILDESSLDDNLKPALTAFRSWQWDNPGIASRNAVTEHRMGHKRLKFAGTADIIIDGYAIIDIKTRKCSPVTDPIQLAAYEKLWTANGGSIGTYHHYILELRMDGTYQFTRVNHRNAWPMFRTLLDYHLTGETIKSWRKK